MKVTIIKQYVFFIKIAVLLCSYLAIFFVSSTVYADHSVSPVMLDYVLEGRDTVSRDVHVTNSTTRLKRLYATVNAINIDSDGIIEPYEPPSTQNRATNPTSWVSVTRGRIEIPAEEDITIPVSLSIPPQVQAGTYHVYVGFSEGRNRPTAEEAIWSDLPPGVIVRIEIKENQSSYLQLSGVNTDRVVYSDNNLIEFTLTNPGSVSQVPFGEVIFYDRRGNEVGSSPVNPDGISIGPNEEKFFYVSAPESSFGRQRAVVNVRYGQGQVANLQDTIFYTRVPLTQMILLFLFLLLLAFIVSYLLHRRYNGQVVFSDGSDGLIHVHNRSGEISFKKVHDITLK